MGPGPIDSKEEVKRLLSAGQAAQAVTTLRALVASGAADAEALALLGGALSMSGDNAGAVAQLERAVGMDPSKPTYYYNLGAVLERTGDRERALQCYRRAAQLDPTYQRASEAAQRLAATGPAAPIAPPAQPAYTPPPSYAAPVRTDLAGNPIYDQPIQPPPYIPPPPAPGGYAPPPSGYPPQPATYGQPGQFPPAPPPTAQGYYSGSTGYVTHDWSSAPGVVKALRLLTVLAFVLYTIGLVVFVILTLSSLSNPAGAVAGIVGLAICGVGLAISFLYYKGLTVGFTALWYIQLVLSILAVCGAIMNFLAIMVNANTSSPYGAGQVGGAIFALVLHGAILFYWFQSDTKEWFNIR